MRLVQQCKNSRYQIVIILVVEIILLGEEITEGGVAQSDCFIRAKLQHGNSIDSVEADARYLDIVSRVSPPHLDHPAYSSTRASPNLGI